MLISEQKQIMSVLCKQELLISQIVDTRRKYFSCVIVCVAGDGLEPLVLCLHACLEVCLFVKFLLKCWIFFDEKWILIFVNIQCTQGYIFYTV